MRNLQMGSSFRRASLCLLLAGALGSAGVNGAELPPAGDVDPIYQQSASAEPSWGATIESVFLHRNRVVPSFALYDVNSGQQALSPNFGADNAAGPRITVRRQFASGQSLSLRYFEIDGWYTAPNLGAGPILAYFPQTQSPTDPGLPNFYDPSVGYRSRVRTLEFNWTASSSNWIRPLIGVRWLRFSDRFDFQGQIDVGGPTLYPLASHVSSRNDLFGMQIGGEVDLWNRQGPLRITGLGKAGVYANSITESYQQDFSLAPFDRGVSTTRTAFVGETGVQLAYDLTNTWTFNCGYQVLWIGGLSQATDQLARFVNNQGIATGASLLLHGANVGITARW